MIPMSEFWPEPWPIDPRSPRMIRISHNLEIPKERISRYIGTASLMIFVYLLMSKSAEGTRLIEMLVNFNGEKWPIDPRAPR